MAKPNQVPESSMEEILASIRKIISEDESKPAVARPRISPPVPLAAASANNVSRLFGDQPDEPADVVVESREIGTEEPAVDEPAIDDPDSVDRMSSLPRYGNLDERPELSEAVEMALSPSDWKPASPREPQSASLLSPRADAAVTSAFNHLASTMLSTNSRTVEQMAEDMMRPMLKEWLDDNLPPLVERLVREEIDRVSRRR